METEDIEVKTETPTIVEGLEDRTDSNEIKAETEAVDEHDPYSYTKRDAFTSEIYKIIVHNLPVRIGFRQVKNMMRALDLKPCKVKLIQRGGGAYAFVNFRCEGDREEALSKLHQHKWKGREIRVEKAKPAPDPYYKKRKLEEEEKAGEEPESKVARLDDTESTPEERLNCAVTPLWKMPYEDQLKKKYNFMNGYIRTVGREIYYNKYQQRSWLTEQRKKYDGLICELEPTKPSPILQGYRNKCEFTIGQSTDGKDKTVGFRLGRYKGGSIHVVEPDQCVNIPEAAKQVAKVTQEYLQTQSKLPAMDPASKMGNWKMVMVRTTVKAEVMAILYLHPQNLSQEEIEAEKMQVKKYFEAVAERLNIKSFYFDVQGEKTHGAENLNLQTMELLFGEKQIEEELLGMKFRISPSAFFQVNTLAAEVLYKTVASWCEISPETTLVDICCGTGTIGLTMAKHAKGVIGIDVCEEAVEDAKANALLNGVTNTKFYCNKAEEILPFLLPGVLKQHGMESLVAVADPPRVGLHPDVVRAIRKCTPIQRMVYVSCNPNGTCTRQNLVDLTRTATRRIRGPPFRLIRAVPVDLFPQTPHCELVMLLERRDDEEEDDDTITPSDGNADTSQSNNSQSENSQSASVSADVSQAGEDISECKAEVI